MEEERRGDGGRERGTEVGGEGRMGVVNDLALSPLSLPPIRQTP